MNLKTKPDKKFIWPALTAFFAASMAVLVCYFLKNEVLGCHDSFEEFMFARMTGFPEWFRHNLDFMFARGRVGILSSLVISFRFFILHTGNYTAIWLLQQVPIWFTVGLLGYVIAKKTRPVFGFLFVGVFAGLVQLDTNHNLMECYPFDFMYGMSLMILGLYLYDCWLMHKGEKRNGIRLALSAFFYYESMTVYEPFITACIIYALLSLCYVYRDRKENGRKSFFIFVRNLLPHALTAVLFFVILKLMKVIYVVDTVAVTAVDEYGDFSDFVNTWSTFTFALFPLNYIDNVDVLTSLKVIRATPFILLFALLAAGVMFSAFMSVRISDAKYRGQDNIRLLVIGLAGFLYAMSFCLPHSMTANYQMWVRDLHAEGYLTSSMCYFGWALMVSCVVSILINLLSSTGRPVFALSAVVMSVLFFVASEVTMNINMVFRKSDAVTGQQMSYRGQAFYSFFTSDYAEDYSAILIYMPGYSGIHFDIGVDDEYADYEVNRNLTLANDIDWYREQSLYSDYWGVFVYNPSVEAGWYTGISNPTDPESEWVSNGDLVFVSTHPGTYEFSYVDPGTQQTVTEVIEAGRMEVYPVSNSAPVDTDTIVIAAR